MLRPVASVSSPCQPAAGPEISDRNGKSRLWPGIQRLQPVIRRIGDFERLSIIKRRKPCKMECQGRKSTIERDEIEIEFGSVRSAAIYTHANDSPLSRERRESEGRFGKVEKARNWNDQCFLIFRRGLDRCSPFLYVEEFTKSRPHSCEH